MSICPQVVLHALHLADLHTRRVRPALVLSLVVAVLGAAEACAQTVIYVNASAPAGGNGQSWATAYRGLQDALDQASQVPIATRNVQVWVAEGRYVPTAESNPGDPRSAQFTAMSKVSVLGGFAGNEVDPRLRNSLVHPTVLSGDRFGDDLPNWGNRADNVYTVVYAGSSDSTAVFDGFTIRDGQGNGVYANAGITLLRCTIMLNRSGCCGAGLFVNSGGSATLDACRIIANMNQGFFVQSGASAYIANSIVAWNTATGDAGGFQVAQASLTLYNCTVAHNQAGGEGGAAHLNLSSLNFQNCIFWGNSSAGGSSLFRGSACTGEIRNSLTDGGVIWNPNSQPNYPGSFSGNPLFMDPDGPDNVGGTLDDDFRLAAASPCVDRSGPSTSGYTDVEGRRRVHDGNSDGNAVADLGAYERGAPAYSPVLYVRPSGSGANNGSSWLDAFSGPLGLQNALSYTQQFPGAIAEVWVAAGIYKPTTYSGPASRGESFQLQNNLAIYGGFQGNETALSQRNISANPTILSGDLLGNDSGNINKNDNSFHVVTAASTASTTTVLDGFAIIAGNANGAGPLDSRGGGLMANGGSATLRRCTLSQNQATDGNGPLGIGGAIFLQHAGGTLHLEDCVLSDNAADRAGAAYVGAGTLLLTRSAVEGNSAPDSAGAIFLESSGALLASHSAFVRNTSVSGVGAVYVDDSATLVVQNTKFLGNVSSESCGAVSSDPAGTTQLSNCEFVGNAGLNNSGSIGALDLGLLAATVTNCTFVCNQSPAGGTAVRVYGVGGSLTANNCLWSQNAAGGIADESAQARSVLGAVFSPSYCGMTGWTGAFGGTGNNAFDPAFIRAPSPGADTTWGTADDDYGDLRLSPSSLAIDSGDSLAVPADSLDIDNDGDVTEALPLDLAGNPRFYDDPSRGNTGNGSPPVDRGAYENNLATTEWINPLGGRFNDAANWVGGVPTSSVRTIFDDSAGGINRAYTATFPSTQNAYALSVLANDVTFNFRSVPGTGSLFLHGPGNDPNNPALLVGTTAALPTSLHLINTGTIVQSLETSNAVIAGGLGSIGTLDVTGRRANFGATSSVDVGRVGTGALGILNESLADIETLRIGTQSGASGAVTIGGSGPIESALLYGGVSGTGSLIVGNAGSGLISVSGVSLLGSSFAQEVMLGKQAGSTGTVTLSGAGAVWSTAQDRFVIGESGNAVLTVTDGALLFTSTASQVTLAKNAGSTAHITIGAGSSWTEDVQSVVLAGDGQATLDLQPGSSLNFQSNLVINPRGTLTGSGTITGGVFNVGTVRVGNSPGTITVNGNYRQFPQLPGVQAGRLEMEVGGTGPGQYDRLVVTGTAELGGGLFVTFPANFVPASNMSLRIIQPNATVGQFDVAYVPLLPDLRFVKVKYREEDGGVSIGLGDLGSGYNPEDGVAAGLNGQPAAATIGNFDGVSGPDLAVALPATSPADPGSVFVFLNAGTSGGVWNGFLPAVLQVPVGVGPNDLAAADFDGDGLDDLAVANQGDSTVRVLSNTGAGTAFLTIATVTTASPPSSVCAAVLYDDPVTTNLPDIAVAEEANGTILLLRGNDTTSPAFAAQPRVGLPGNPTAVDPSDIDDDKRNDVVAALSGPGGNGSLVVVQNIAYASFSQTNPMPIGQGPVDLTTADLNGDPYPEIVIANTDDGTVSVIVNRTPDDLEGDITLAPAVNLPMGGQARSVSIADIDGDGDNDIAVVAGGASRSVFALRNDTDPLNAALSLAQPLAVTTTPNPLLVVAADVDGSGIQDLIGLGDDGEALGDEIVARPAAHGCDATDFNQDGLFPDTADIDDFLSVFSGGPCSNDPNCADIDFNNDGLFPDTLDIDSLLSVFSGGPCL